MPTNMQGFLQIYTKRLQHGNSFVGVDLGTYSTKIVQLGMRNGDVYVETYGEISNAAYADAEPGKAIRPSTHGQAEELQNILHEVDAQSRLCGVAMPLAETLMSAVDLPKRDKEQMDKIVPVEAQRFIPVPVSEIMLDWYAIPDEQTNAFDTVRSGQKIAAQFQKIMLVGINKKTAQNYRTTISQSGLLSTFFEIEIFSAIRASLHAKKVPTLILDLGASSTKAAIVNEHWILLAARLIPTGGSQITEDISKAQKVDFTAAERIKCEQGLTYYSPARNTIMKSLSSICTYAKQVIDEHDKQFPRHVENILLCGGGSLMPDIQNAIKDKLSLPVELVQGFARTKGPMILEQTFIEDGPRYAVAVGLALRGMGK
jgi:type IV pilus assembly protein PilM